MAIASQSLFNMTVGADSTPSSQGLLMPKLQYRFRALFINFGVGGSTQELTKQVMDIQRPSLTFDETTIDIYNSRIYLAGKHTWAETQINLRDDAGGNVSKLVGQQLQKQFDFVEQASAATGGDYKFQINYEVLDGGNGTLVPNVLETWELYGCFIKAANYNNMDYKSNEPVTIQLSIRFDNAVQSPLSSGVGTSVGRALSGSTSVTGIG
jgi:hypothetical protein